MISSIAKHLICQCALASIALAGTPASKAPPSVAISPTVDPWEVTLSLPVWLSGVDGTVGVRGFTAGVSADFGDIIQNVDMIAAATFEIKKGRWGGWIDGIYLKASVGGDTPGPLLDSLDVGVEQVILEAAVFYRAWQSERGFLDLYAGARYMSIGGEMSFGVSDSGVQQVSEQLSQKVVDEVVSAVKSQADAALVTARNKIISNVTAAGEDKIAEAVTAKATSARTALNNLEQIAAAYPQLVETIRNDSRLQAAIQSVAEARIDEKLADAAQRAANASTVAAAVKTTLQAAANGARSRAQKAVAKAEKDLASKIESALQDAIPSQISQSLDWVDPFVGLRACYNFTDRLYAIGKADIGGFGVSSDLVWNAYGALGYHLTKSGKTTVELGYRYMAVDYTRGGFTFDVAMSGVMLNLGVKF